MKKYILMIIFVFFIFPVKSQELTILELMIHEERMVEEFDNVYASINRLKVELQDTKDSLSFMNALIIKILQSEHKISGEDMENLVQALEEVSGYKIK